MSKIGDQLVFYPLLQNYLNVQSKNSSAIILTKFSIHTFQLLERDLAVLLAITEEWRRALDGNEYLAALLMDLSKAFDCLPSNLIKDKLIAYDLSKMQSIW